MVIKTPPHLKYVVALLCNLLLMACFADSDINVSQVSVATYARCVGTFNIHLTANLPRNLPHTHTHPFNGPLSRTTRVGRYQKGKTNLDFTEARDSEWQ